MKSVSYADVRHGPVVPLQEVDEAASRKLFLHENEDNEDETVSKKANRI
jgi:hypothetical protein